ncbi:PREDICTED: uncharacterized protein LOC106125652 [Papilio xuthus]|uniref:Uncharacterized protein LOC106125652 n=1 Tax=Papilio xuthus TaxID=66420 RepID=A0AAJ6ZSJ7_PAPXU|nr:PREDICTED: uncharacterized protein LOC106125652 [Papilio xuthus]
MKTLLITIALVAFTASEPPPSKSYLPPPSGRSTGYPQGPAGGPAFDAGIPEVVAARSLSHQDNDNGFGRNSFQDRGVDARLVNGLRDQQHGRFGANGVRDESDTVSLEAESGFKSRVSYQDSEEHSGYDANNGRSNGYRSRSNLAARSNGY